MKTKTYSTHGMGSFLLMFILSSGWASAKFVPPTDAVPFRRDQLPVDVETMSQLSRQLSLLCTTLAADDLEGQRTAAQLLALAQALDPVNPQVDELLKKFAADEKSEAPAAAAVNVAKSRAWRTQSWFASEEAGKDGQILADCLADTLAKIDPAHPSAVTHKEEKGKWVNWVAPLTDFSPKAMPDIAELPDDKDVPTDTTDDSTKNPGKFLLKTASIQSPFWMYNEATKTYTLAITPVTLKTSIDTEYPAFRYNLAGVDKDTARPILQSINKNTIPRLEEKFSALPEGGVVDLQMPTNAIYSLRRNGENISAAAAVLSSAALTGEEPTGIVIGIVQKDGTLALPKNGWELIRLLDAAPTSRVVLPKSMEELLPSLLVLDRMNVFMKHDIFFAENYDELIAFSKKKPDPAVAEALANFADIRAKSPNNVGPFIVNPFVSKRLEAIAAAHPYFASARFLFMQAKGNRPTVISDKVLAYEIRMALAPLNEIGNQMRADSKQLGDLDATKVQKAHESAREALDPLEKLIGSADRPLYAEAIDLANSARTLARALRTMNSRGFDDNKGKSSYDKSSTDSFKTLSKGLPAIEEKIGFILGEPRPQLPVDK